MDKAQDLWADGGLKHPEAPGLKDPNLGVQLPNPLIGQTPGAPMIQDYQQIQQLQLLQVISCFCVYFNTFQASNSSTFATK